MRFEVAAPPSLVSEGTLGGFGLRWEGGTPHSQGGFYASGSGEAEKFCLVLSARP